MHEKHTLTNDQNVREPVYLDRQQWSSPDGRWQMATSQGGGPATLSSSGTNSRSMKLKSMVECAHRHELQTDAEISERDRMP